MIDSIIEKLEQKPFRPFQILLTSGDRYEVTNPHMVAMTRSSIFYAVPNTDHFAELRQNQIAAVESLNPAA